MFAKCCELYIHFLICYYYYYFEYIKTKHHLDITHYSYNLNNTYSVIFTDTRMSDGLVDTAMQNDKRQDLDHVFLRFGRRRR